mmetsp:Transcript_27113/g.37853  ORF Transcript_27113/g.37853 Transcript_27113/m.37853 type:complete len:95 (+) Transcript_27113:276-560(+)
MEWKFKVEKDIIEECEWMKVDVDTEHNCKERGTSKESKENLELARKKSFDSCDLNMSFDAYMWEKGESDDEFDKDQESHDCNDCEEFGKKSRVK